MVKKLLTFDISAPFGHFKVIYATTSALTYPIPSKTAIYGMVGSIIGLSKEDNSYLNSFKDGQCKIALQILKPLATQRLHINWSPTPGAIKSRKPTLVEHMANPAYRIYFTHEDPKVYDTLKKHLMAHTTVFTLSMGLANLIANFHFIGESNYEEMQSEETDIHSIIPLSSFIGFGDLNEHENFITSMSQYAMEMTTGRDVTKRDEVLIDRKGMPIKANVKGYQRIYHGEVLTNIILH